MKGESGMAEKKIPAHVMVEIQKMEQLGIYKPEFYDAVERYAKLKKEYKTVYKKYEKSGFVCEVQTSQGTKKAPIVATLESLRKDILSAEDALGLNPRGLLKLNENAFVKQRENKAGGLI
jgi:P27 family predicted phage terminase small subunit